jgi:Oxidoreductase family, NAD-binding Rossmann fold
MKTPIRVGIIRCDTHAMWYGAQMQGHDSVLLERPVLFKEDKDARYSWMTRGVHYFYYTNYRSPRRMTAPHVEGFEIARVWDEDKEAAALFARVFHDKPVVCDTYEQVSDDVDLVFIADCNGDGGDHVQLSMPGLKKGVATFIDKPFARTSQDVRVIKEAADKSGAPVMSLSILQTNPATARIARTLEGLGPVGFGSVTCAYMHPAALIHAISTVHHVFGTGIQTVGCLSAADHTVVHLGYGGRADRPGHGVVINAGVADFRFTEMFVCAYGPQGAVQGTAMNDFNASEGSAIILEHIRSMVRERKPHLLGDEMIAAIAVMDAVSEAQATGRIITIQEPDGCS